MAWTRSNTFRGIVIALLGTYLVIQVVQRDWPWVALMVALLVANIASWRAQRTRLLAQSASAAPSGALVPAGVDVTLGELLDRPAVRHVWSTAPPVWRQVSYLDDEADLALDADAVADHVWITTSDDGASQAHWSVAVGDELKPLLDLDIDQDADPLVTVIEGHDAVIEAVHSDREVYDVVLRSPMTLDEIAVLAARALIAHHLDALEGLRGRID